MGRNNIENRSKDINWAYNDTLKTTFKCEILNENDCRNLEISQGLNMMSVKMAIRINGVADIRINNFLKIKGKTRKVIAIQPEYENDLQGKYKGSLDSYTGSFKVGLE